MACEVNAACVQICTFDTVKIKTRERCPDVQEVNRSLTHFVSSVGEVRQVDEKTTGISGGRGHLCRLICCACSETEMAFEVCFGDSGNGAARIGYRILKRAQRPSVQHQR